MKQYKFQVFIEAVTLTMGRVIKLNFIDNIVRFLILIIHIQQIGEFAIIQFGSVCIRNSLLVPMSAF